MTKLKLQTAAIGHPPGLYKDEICGITGGAHVWSTTEHERHINRSSCKCGRIIFETNQLWPKKKTIDRIEFLNEKHGKPGKVYTGPPRVKPQYNGNAVSQTKKEENIMAGVIEANKLHPETKEKLGINKQGTDFTAPLTLIPPEAQATLAGEIRIMENHENYTAEERKSIIALYNTASDKDAKHEILKKYNVRDGRVIHGWDCILNQNISQKSIAAKKAKAEARKAAGIDNKTAGIDNKTAGIDNNAPPAAEKYICTQDCILKGDDCKQPESKLTADPTAPNCPLYRPWHEPLNKEPERIVKIIEYKVKVDTSDLDGLDAKINNTRDKVEELNRLRVSILPRFRWYWAFFPGFMKYYLSTLERLTDK